MASSTASAAAAAAAAFGRGRGLVVGPRETHSQLIAVNQSLFELDNPFIDPYVQHDQNEKRAENLQNQIHPQNVHPDVDAVQAQLRRLQVHLIAAGVVVPVEPVDEGLPQWRWDVGVVEQRVVGRVRVVRGHEPLEDAFLGRLVLDAQLEELGHVVDEREDDDGDDESLGRVHVSAKKKINRVLIRTLLISTLWLFKTNSQTSSFFDSFVLWSAKSTMENAEYSWREKGFRGFHFCVHSNPVITNHSGEDKNSL